MNAGVSIVVHRGGKGELSGRTVMANPVCISYVRHRGLMSRLPAVGDGGLIDWVSAEGDRPQKGPVVEVGKATGRERPQKREFFRFQVFSKYNAAVKIPVFSPYEF